MLLGEEALDLLSHEGFGAAPEQREYGAFVRRTEQLEAVFVLGDCRLPRHGASAFHLFKQLYGVVVWFGARISRAKAERWLGSFDPAEEAARAYDAAVVEVWGARAITNFNQPAALVDSTDDREVFQDAAVLRHMLLARHGDD